MEERLPPPPPPNRDRKKKKSVVLPLLLFFVTFILLLGVIGIILVVSALRSPKAISAPRNSVLRIQLSGELPEYVPPSGLAVLTGKKPFFFYDYLALIEKAKNDPKIAGIYLEIYPLSAGYAQMSELRHALQDFQAADKFVTVYGEMWSESEYYLASVGDDVFMTPESMLMLDGFMSRISFYQEALAWAGIKVDVAAFKEYKSFADSYRYAEMTDAHRESTTALLSEINQNFIKDVASSREIAEEKVSDALTNGTYDAETAFTAGLIDGVQYRDQVEASIAKKLNTDVKNLHLIEFYRYFIPNHGQPGGTNQVAVLLANGTINSGTADRGAFGDSVVGSDWFVDQVRSIREDDRIKAVVVRIDSPGGSGLASDVMWRELKNLEADGIPLVASMGNVAASGGYYLAMGCPTIFCEPMTITGSIGVVAMRIDMADFYNNIKVNVQVLKTGPNADFFDPYRPLTDEERDAFLQRTGQFYQAFVEKAAESRNKAFDDFEPLAHGRVWSGSAALQNGLVDRQGGLMDAVRFAAQSAGLSRYSVRLFPGEKDFWALLQDSQVEAKNDPVIDQVLPPLAKRLVDLNVAKQPQPLAVLPFDIEIQ